jgi:hypothetical protein
MGDTLIGGVELGQLQAQLTLPCHKFIREYGNILHRMIESLGIEVILSAAPNIDVPC